MLLEQLLMEIIQNSFFRSIIIPILFTFAAALFDSTTALVKGRCKGIYKYRAWVRQEHRNGHVTISPMMGQSLATVRERSDIVDIDTMVNFDIADFGSVGVDLIVGSFAVDIASLLRAQNDPTRIGYILIMHLFSLIGILMFLMLSQLSGPDEQKSKRILSSIAIGLGIVAMMVSFLAL
jgi:hypothetical protein